MSCWNTRPFTKRFYTKIFKMFFDKNEYTKRMQILLSVLFLSSLILITHSLGLEFFLYWNYIWFDVVLHFLGGLTLGLFFSLFFKKEQRRILILLVVAVIVGWEIFEIAIGTTNISSGGFVFDTVFDLLIGFLSAYLGIFFSEK